MAIRFATREDEPRIVQFLRDHWNGNSILANSPVIFEYQYMKQHESGFVIAEDDNGGICGIKGFIPMNSGENPDVAAALAIALQGTRPMLNMEMQRYLEKNTKCRMMCSTGLNPNTAARVYPFFRYKVDRLKQYYRLNQYTQFRVAGVTNSEMPPVKESEWKFIPLTDMENLLKHFRPEVYQENRPFKDAQYIRYRYFEHPVYYYRMYGITKDGEAVTALFVTREIECNGSRVIRVVDYIGDRQALANLSQGIQELLEARSAEYIDFYCYGMPEDVMEQAGFVLRTEDDTNIIPNYFEPFEQKNIDIIFFCNLHEDFLICKADGDQDRPSQMPG